MGKLIETSRHHRNIGLTTRKGNMQSGDPELDGPFTQTWVQPRSVTGGRSISSRILLRHAQYLNLWGDRSRLSQSDVVFDVYREVKVLGIVWRRGLLYRWSPVAAQSNMPWLDREMAEKIAWKAFKIAIKVAIAVAL